MDKRDWPLEGIDIESIRAIIDSSSRLFHGFVARAVKAQHANKPHAAVAWAQIAADVAWNSHAGLYCSSVLENLLLQVAQEVDRIPSPFRKKLPGEMVSRQKVLHVLSIAFPTGGHTRVAERWIQNTQHRATHAVVITGIGDCSPQWLGDAAEASGGWLMKLDSRLPGLLDRAKALRDIAREWADLVVLHTHPNDPLPILAFGVESVPPVIYFNHADHVFWLGASIADVVADLRPAGQALTRSRRGGVSSGLLPIPLVPPKSAGDRTAARNQLGLGEKTTVLLSIASSYKFAPLGGFDYLELHRRVLARHPDTVLLAVGPSDTGRWAEFRSATAGCIRAFGEQSDLTLYHAAADIYLDSFPFASLTSMFEVGLLEKPVIGLTNPVSPIHSGDDISLNRCETHLSTREDYEEELHRLITDRGLRDERGRAVAQGIKDDHVPPGWDSYLDKLMTMVPARHAPAPLNDVRQEPDMDDVFLACIQQAAGMSAHVYDFLAMHIKYLPIGDRYALAIENLLRKGIFAERQFRLKVFRSYRTPTGRQFKKMFREWRQRK